MDLPLRVLGVAAQALMVSICLGFLIIGYYLLRDPDTGRFED